MAQLIPLEEREALFSSDDAASPVWSADLIQMPDGTGEVFAFRYHECRYLLFFLDPVAFVGGDAQTLEDWAPIQSDGFVPHPKSRLLKFFRAEAETDEFVEKRWPLPSGKDIFSFCQVLTDLLAFHAETYLDLQQYFYLAASPRLAKLYERMFRQLQNTPGCVLADFESILTETGEYDGYQRKVAKREDFGNEASRRAA